MFRGKQIFTFKFTQSHLNYFYVSNINKKKYYLMKYFLNSFKTLKNYNYLQIKQLLIIELLKEVILIYSVFGFSAK